MRPPLLIRQPSAHPRRTRAALGIRNEGNSSSAAGNAARTATTLPHQSRPRPQTPAPPPLPFFSDLGLDRCSAARKDAALLAELSAREGAAAIIVRGGDALTVRVGSGDKGKGGEGESSSSSSGSSGSGSGRGEDPDAPASPDLFLARLPLAEAQKLLLESSSAAAAGSEDGDSPIFLGAQQQQEEAEGEESSSSSSGLPPPPLLLPAGAPLFAVALPRGPEGDAAAARAVELARTTAMAAAGATTEAFSFVPVRSEGPRMPPRAAAAAALAVGLSSFHSRARFDPATGAATRMASAGHARDAVVVVEGEEERGGEGKKRDGGGAAAVAGKATTANDGEEKSRRRKRPNRSRPRVDPAVLVLASCRDHVLLGRKRSWPARRYSLLAGFAELGETLEQAAERELAEEAGVVVGSSRSSNSSNRYLGSQPWPFPSSLMVAMRVDVDPVALPEEEGKDDETGGGELPIRASSSSSSSPPLLTPREVELATWPSRRLPAALPLDGELEDVRWFPAEAVREACEGAAARCGLRLPGKHALARTVLAAWAAEVESREASSSSSPPCSSRASFFASLFSSKAAFPCVPLSLPESNEGEEGGTAAVLPFELFRVKKGEEDGGGGGAGGGETALALRWLGREERGAGGRERLIRAVEREASTACLSVEALGGGEIVFGRRGRKKRQEGEGEEEGAGRGGASSVPPPKERRVALRSSRGSSSSSKDSSSSPPTTTTTPAAAASLLLEVCACLFRRAHPLAEVSVE